jgi:hypothetical protein
LCHHSFLVGSRETQAKSQNKPSTRPWQNHVGIEFLDLKEAPSWPFQWKNTDEEQAWKKAASQVENLSSTTLRKAITAKNAEGLLTFVSVQKDLTDRFFR